MELASTTTDNFARGCADSTGYLKSKKSTNQYTAIEILNLIQFLDSSIESKK